MVLFSALSFFLLFYWTPSPPIDIPDMPLTKDCVNLESTKGSEKLDTFISS